MQVFWCHNGDEFTLPFLEPFDISKFFFSPKSSRYQSLPVHVFLKPQSHVIHVEQPGTRWATFSASFYHAQTFTIDDYIMTYLLFQNSQKHYRRPDQNRHDSNTIHNCIFKINAIMPIMKINIYITGTLNCIPSSE